MATFLEKNKKKTALAGLLLFLRTRKTVGALLLLVALTSFLFVSPSSVVLRFPGGARVAAAMAWIAGKMGADTAKWGLAGGKRDYRDLVAAFRAAKEGGGQAGWAAFMREERADAGRAGVGAGSIGYVKGRAEDLAAKAGGGAKLPKPKSVAGVLSPEDSAKQGAGGAVALDESVLPGGGSFGGDGGRAASGSLEGMVSRGLEDVKVSTAAGVRKAAAKGTLSGSRAPARPSLSNAQAGSQAVSCSAAPGQCAFVQLAVGRAWAKTGAEDCTDSSGCPREFASAKTGKVYDNNEISDGLLSGSAADGASSVNLPDSEAADAAIRDAEQMAECTERVAQCEDERRPDYVRMGQLQTELTNLFMQMPGACGNPCSCDGCNSLQGQIGSKCGELVSVMGRVGQPCALPSFCAALGVEAPTPTQTTSALSTCLIQTGSCGCSNWFCDIRCITGF
ncbi:MAG: hypothetical protein HY403_02580 [Elusimicrobia bacterium]|nr:hypothetical protein [Elusimicrobiota bacterium]